MDVDEARLLFTRVQGFDSENAFKIMGYLLLQDWGQQDLIHLALGSDVMLVSLINKAKKELGLSIRTMTPLLQSESVFQSQPNVSHFLTTQAPTQALSQVSSSLLIPGVNDQWTVPSMDPLQHKISISQDHGELGFVTSGGSLNMLGQHPYVSVNGQSNYMQMPTNWASTVDANLAHLSSSLAWKPCLFFSRGYCKHGNNCRFLHPGEKEFCTQVASPPREDYVASIGLDDGFVFNGSLDCLERELRELLRGRRSPVSIASLPQLYYEKFGKTLQAEGYLTESQRHGKAGYSLTKLLVRLKGCVTLIERPHGQHAVVLTEDAHKFTDFRGKRDDYYNAINSSSRQIYLTFPAESTFTEEDVTIHFREYGPVQDVRIPYQQKRMFGFVTFIYADTVTAILAEGSPHYICGARVLVKPYKEKGSKMGDRKLQDGDQLKHTSAISQSPVSRYSEGNQLAKHMEDDTIAGLERRIAELQLTRIKAEARSVDTFGFDADNTALTAEDCLHLQSNAVGYVLDILDEESNDSDTTDSTIGTFQRLDSESSDSSLEPPIAEAPANSADNSIKRPHLSSQSAFLNQYSWGAPTLFAHSVF